MRVTIMIMKGKVNKFEGINETKFLAEKVGQKKR